VEHLSGDPFSGNNSGEYQTRLKRLGTGKHFGIFVRRLGDEEKAL
jgi:hypothetical protein